MGRWKDLESYIKETTDNIRDDRGITNFLLTELIQELKSGGSHLEHGIIAAKYVETLQRSNEQLVKLAALIQKNSKGNQGLSPEDKEDLFDLINTSSNEESG